MRTNFGVSTYIDMVPRRTLPRTSSGKLSRSRACADFMERMTWDEEGRPVPVIDEGDERQEANA
jgi:hypothetical protein